MAKYKQNAIPPYKKIVIFICITCLALTISCQQEITANKPMLINNPDSMYRRIPYWDMNNQHFNIKSVKIISPEPNYKILSGEYSSSSWLSMFKSSDDYVITQNNHVFWISEVTLPKKNVFFHVEKNSYINIDDDGVHFMKGRKSMKINLNLAKTKYTYDIGAYGDYYFNQPVLELETEGFLVELKSSFESIPNKIVWYGNLKDFGDIEGILEDDLDFENKENSKLTYLGNILGNPVYIKCGDHECDVYYTEILAGKFYVGYLYTLTSDDLPTESQGAQFCP